MLRAVGVVMADGSIGLVNLQGTLQEHDDGRLSIAALVDVSERADALPC